MSAEYQSLKEQILQQISDGQTKMRPRSYFIVRGTLLAVGTVVMTLTLLYTISLIVFVTQLNGASELPAFGLQGIAPFIFSLPWILIGACLIAMVILELLVHHYAFAYRKPLVYSLIGVFVVTILGSMVVARFRLHEQLFEFAQEERLPLAGPFYRDYDRHRPHNIYPGIIATLNENGFNLITRQAETFTIIVNEQTAVPAGWIWHQGDMVVVLGSGDDQEITALGIRPWHSEFGHFQPNQPMMPPR
jgi:hypothetical protein